MSTIAIGFIVSGCVFGGGMVALLLSPLLPDRHRSAEARDVVRLGIGVVSVLASLVLGLLTASADDAFHSVEEQLRSYAAELIQLDQLLRDYGTAADPIRKLLLRYTSEAYRTTWPEQGPAQSEPLESTGEGELLNRAMQGILSLTPANEAQHWLRGQALDVARRLIEQRWALLIGQHGTISPMLMSIMVIWVIIIFASFGLNAPRNTIVMLAFLLCAASIGTSVFLILELDTPFSGIIMVSGEPMKNALDHLSQ